MPKKKKESLQQIYTIEALRKYPERPSLQIARILYEEHPTLFPTLDAARARVRYYRGNHGKENRKCRDAMGTHPDVIRKIGKAGDLVYDKLPKPLEIFGDATPYKLTAEKTLILSDIHAPFHDQRALACAIEDGVKRGVDAVILNGDIADYHRISYFLKEPTKLELKEEVEVVRDILGIIRDTFKDATIIFKDGNHEERWFKYLWQKAPELWGDPDFSLEQRLRLPDYGIKRLTKRQHIELGNLCVFHGHEFGRSISTPVSAARGLFLRAVVTGLIGHFHHTSEHITKTARGKLIGCFSTGCLCDLKPDYLPYNKWNHGYAIVTQEEEDYFHVDNKKIVDGRIF